MDNSLAISLQTVPDLLIGFEENVLEVLEDTMSDRVVKVQQAARFAKKRWDDFNKIFDVIEEKKWVIDTEMTGLYPEEILQIRTGLEDTANERITYFLQNKVKDLYSKGPKQSDPSPIGK